MLPAAIPGVSSSTPPAHSRAAVPAARPSANVAGLGANPQSKGYRGNNVRVGTGQGLLRIVSPDELQQEEARRDAEQRAAQANAQNPPSDLSVHIRRLWTIYRNHRNQGNDPINYRLLRAQRMIDGKYDPEKLAAIAKFGGSEVYSRLVATKCRGATSLLRDVYLGPERPWGIDPQSDPPIPGDIRASIIQLVATEVGTLKQSGQVILPEKVHERYVNLMHAAEEAARRNAMEQADRASDKLQDMLRDGGFYEALAEFLTDLPIFPFACLKGPIVRMQQKLVWENHRPVLRLVPTLCWRRMSPFDIYWTPGASCIEEANVLERQRLTRADLNALLGLPGYDDNAIRGALEDYDRGLREWIDYPDIEEALNVGREDPNLNLSEYIDAIEFHGHIQGSVLLDEGVDPKLVPDPTLDYQVQTWVVGHHVLKTQFNPNPRHRHPYYVTSFEKVPGAVMGHGLCDILEDLQEMGNATLRAMVNNMAIASGPQVVVDDDMVIPTDNSDDLYPWKRWHVAGDNMGMMGANRTPVNFFQPQSNAQELMQIYAQISALADDISAIPRYVTGEGAPGGAGRTASGLSMLLSNSAKILQTVAANVDRDVMMGVLQGLYDLVMLTDQSGILTGEEEIVVNGVNVAVTKETERQKQLQFLQITANPIDAPIVGVAGRAKVLRSVASNMGLPDDIVPDDQAIQQMQRQQQAAQMQMAQAAAAQQQAAPPGAQPSPAAQAQGNQPPQATPARLSDHAPPVNQFQQGAPYNGT